MVSCLVVKRHPVPKDAVEPDENGVQKRFMLKRGNTCSQLGEMWEPGKYEASHIGDRRR